MVLKRGEVYYIDFGMTIGSVQGGKRPGIIIQNDVGNKFSPNVIAVPITSQNKPHMPTHARIKQGEGGLSRDSIALLENPVTLSKSCIISRMGMLSDETMMAVDAAIDVSLGRTQKVLNVVAVDFRRQMAASNK